LSESLKRHIKKLQSRSARFHVIFMLTFICFLMDIVMIVYRWLWGIAILSLLVFGGILYIIGYVRVVRKEERESPREPVVFSSGKNLSYEKLTAMFEAMTDEANHLSTSNDVHFFRLNHIFQLRIVLFKTALFNKKEFDAAKARINKKANTVLNISQYAYGVFSPEQQKKMRFNIICAGTMNDALYHLISQNALRNLERVEGVINIAIIGNQILIPPIYGDCAFAEIRRYKGVIRFIDQVILG